MKHLCLTIALAALALHAAADNDWLKINRADKVVTAYPFCDFTNIEYTSSTADGTFDGLTLWNGDKALLQLPLKNVTGVEITTNVPRIYINTPASPTLTEVQSKETYVKCTFEMRSFGAYKDVPLTEASIKGRGNSTWAQFPKKPYNVKFGSKVSLCGLTKAKTYCLIANYIDCTLMRNSVAFKLAQLLNMPYTNHSVPVAVVFNGIEKGAYMLTEKVGVGKASVDIDETKGLLFELDQNYDEAFKFHSARYSLPVMVKDPDLTEIAETLLTDALVAETGNKDAKPSKSDITNKANELFAAWKADFQTMEDAVAAGTGFDKIDMTSAVNYLLVYNLTGNHEPCHPKSVYLHKKELGDGEKYCFGPVWDFDWAYTFDGNFQEGAGTPTDPLLRNNSAGASFLKKLCQDAKFKTAFNKQWTKFKRDLYPQLLQYIDDYAALIRLNAQLNGEVWPKGSSRHAVESSKDIDANVQTLKTWLQQRVDYIDGNANKGLY